MEIEGPDLNGANPFNYSLGFLACKMLFIDRKYIYYDLPSI